MSDQYRTWRDYYLVIQGFFYGSQGIAYGVALFFAAYMRSLGVSDDRALLLQSLLLIPWYIKFLFGVLSDNVAIGSFGRRKPYVFIAAVIGAVGWFTLTLFESFSILLILSGVAAAGGIALADAAIDALAVDITPPHRRGTMQGVSWGFRAIGFGATTLIGGVLVEQGQWTLLFVIPGVLSTLSSLLVLLFGEIPLPADFSRVSLSVYKKVFSHSGIRKTLLFQLISGTAISIIFLLETFLSQELQYNPSEIGRVLFIFAIGMFGGSILIGVLGDAFQLRTMLQVVSVLYMGIIASIFLFDLGNLTQISIYFGLIGLINGGYEATQMRLGMDYSPKVVSGTMFNLYNSTSNIGQIGIGPILVYAIISLLPAKVAWQVILIVLLIAFLIALRLIKTHTTEETYEIGMEVIS